MKRSDFLLDVAHSLGACQLLELEIKLYVERAFDVIRKKTKGVVPFLFTGADYEDASLERLIGVFRKVCRNKPLIGRLEKLRKDRNFIAHKAIAACLDCEGDFDSARVRKVRALSARIAAEAHALASLVQEESAQFLGHYYFDVGSDAERPASS